MLGVAHIALLKIDVEGFEMAVLRGCRGLFDRIDNIIFEHLPENAADYAMIQNLLSGFGFEFRTVTGEPYVSGEPPEHNIWARRAG